MNPPKLAPMRVALDLVVPRYKTRDENPNKMDPERFVLLVAEMRDPDIGFLQPILARPGKTAGTVEIIDGHHRFWAAQEAGLTHIQMILASNLSPAQAAGLAIGMNRLRGDLDITMAAQALRELEEDTGWNTDQMALLTGFTQTEISELLHDHNTAEVNELLEGAGHAPAEEEPPPPSRPFTLEIRFADKASYQLAKRKLRKAAGASKDLSLGLLNVLGELDHH